MGVARNHYTTAGIKENLTFSINLPSTDMVTITDYVGLVSGEKVDKSKTFDVFYGKLKTAPLVSECALSMECKVTDILDRGGVDDIIIGEIIETYCNDDCVTDGNPDIKKMDLPVFSMFENKYFKIGEYIGKGWGIGRKLIKED